MKLPPVVYQNLLVVAGEWAGFDETGLHNKIQQNLSKPKTWGKFRFFISHSGMFYATKEHWATLEKLFLAEDEK